MAAMSADMRGNTDETWSRTLDWWARPCHHPQARADDGRRRDRDERVGQGLGVHGASAERHGCTLTPQHTSDLVRFFMTPWASRTQTGQPG